MSVMNFYIVVINKGQYTKHMLRGPRLADNIVKTLQNSFSWHKTKEIWFWVRFGYGRHLRSKSLGLFRKMNHYFMG